MKVTIKKPTPEALSNLYMVTSTSELGVYSHETENLVCLYPIGTRMGHVVWFDKSKVEQLAVGTTLEVVL